MKKNIAFLIALLAFAAPLAAGALSVASYNIRNDNASDRKAGNGWDQRCPAITALIRFHDFDIFGTQEGKINQLRDMIDQLPGYARTGVARDDAGEKGEFSAIFYKTDKFTLLDHGDFWLSPDSDRPNKGWDASHIRICSWGKFSDKQTGKVFYFFNVHTDHKGMKAREEGSRLILSKIAEIAKGADAILTGDFNMTPDASGYRILTATGLLKDAREIAPIRYELNGTFNGFKPDRFSPDRIDYIFVTAGFSVARYGVLTDTYRAKIDNDTHAARVPSDHFPIVAALRY